MKRLVCLIRGHQHVEVRVTDPYFVVPGSGIFVEYEAVPEDEDGTHVACERCRRVLGRLEPDSGRDEATS